MSANKELIIMVLGVLLAIAGAAIIINDNQCKEKPVPELRIGEMVSNGLCSGQIMGQTRSEYRVMPWNCRTLSMNFAWVPKSEVYSIEKVTK